VEITGKFSSSTAPHYNMRYVKRPRPIILVNLKSSNLGSTLSIDGEQTAMTSELPEELHEEILQRAIELAKAAWTATGRDNAQMVMEMGKRSE
jgi:signal-transduction protein with cAMP-binding, CBS, and nucleotidyltransferase domain